MKRFLDSFSSIKKFISELVYKYIHIYPKQYYVEKEIMLSKEDFPLDSSI